MSTGLHAGRLSATLEGADLVDVRWGGLDVASRIQVTLRDPDWGTVSPSLRSSTVEHSADAFQVSLEAAHQDDDGDAFVWRGTIEGNDEGMLRFAIDGSAERSFSYRRIGICVLHPSRSYAGATYRASGDGFVEGVFPIEIAPQWLIDDRYHAMIEAFSVLDVRFSDRLSARFAFEGEWFELEDQRNWTDASFKTYPTPLARSQARTMRQGEAVVQEMTLRIHGRAPAVHAGDDVTIARIGEPTGWTMPPIGLVAPGDPSLRPAHLRVDVDVAEGDDAAVRDAVTFGVPLEVALQLDDEATGLEAMASRLAGLPIARLLIHLLNGATIPGPLVQDVRARLATVTDGVPIVGGTSSYFSELNRLSPDVSGVDAIAFGVSPTVHASDERSMMETLEIQGDVARQAHKLARGLPIIVSPVVLDAHTRTPFADAWTIGSVANLVAAGVASLTYASPARSLAVVMALEGQALLDVTSSQPQRVTAISTESAVIVTNLTPVAQRFRIDDEERRALSAYEVRTEPRR